MGKSNIQMVNAYLLITDLHDSYQNKENRYDYLKEITHVKNKILELVSKYKGYDYKVHIILLGDVYNNSYKDITKGIVSNNYMVYLRQLVDSMYSVLGNHEFTYYADNPFWTLMTEIESEKVERIKNKSWQPLGLLPVLRVVDKIYDGEVVIHFNHYNTEVNRPEPDKINIGLFHTDIISKEIIADMRENNGLNIFEVKDNVYLENASSVLYGYDYSFLGHMHKIYGHWTYTDNVTDYKTELYYLASLGRSNETEVNDKFLERNIPAIIVENGKFIKVEDNKFNLMSRAECVKETIVEKNREAYEKRKEIKYTLSYNPIGDDPLDNLRAALDENPFAREVLEVYISGDVPTLDNEINKTLEELKWL